MKKGEIRESALNRISIIRNYLSIAERELNEMSDDFPSADESEMLCDALEEGEQSMIKLRRFIDEWVNF